MATMAKWGSKTWAVSAKKVVALEGLSFSYTQVADNNTSTEEKKTTNERGTELFPLSFTTTLHAGAGVDVRAEIESWKNLVTKVNYFYLGGKRLGPKLQLRKVNVSDIKLDDLGRIRLAKLSFEFKEYDPDTTSVKVDTSALDVKPSTSAKSQKKVTNTAVKKATKKTVKVGSYVKPTGKRYYVRYQDDVIILGNDLKLLHEWKDKIEALLNHELYLDLNNKTSIRPIRQGVEFVGWRIWPTHRKIRKSTARRIKREVRKISALYAAGDMNAVDFNRRVDSIRGLLEHSECASLRWRLNEIYREEMEKAATNRLRKEAAREPFADHSGTGIGDGDPGAGNQGIIYAPC